MDPTSIFGVALGLAVIGIGLEDGNLLGIFINSHGILIVFGGTIAATLVNTPAPLLYCAVKEIFRVFFGRTSAKPEALASEMVQMARQWHVEGMHSLQNRAPVKGDGFLHYATRVALSCSDAQSLRRVLEDAIAQEDAAMQRAAGVVQTMGTLSPMFGLLGTIIGIVGVLKDIANPKSVGPAMAISITTAFYGILVSALFCTPIAGKIRSKAQEATRVRRMILTGILDIVAGAIPVEVEQRLQPFIQKK